MPRRRLRARIVTLAVSLGVAPAAIVPSRAVPTTGGTRYAVAVDGAVAHGWLGLPPTRAPSALLVHGHGCCGKPDQSAFVANTARTTGAVVVAMDYRGPGRWDVLAGSRDLVAATTELRRRFPSIRRVVLHGVSMGGEVTGMAAAARPDLFDFWVSVFGVSDLATQYASLGTYPSPTASWIAQETGGLPATRHGEYVRRSPVHLAGSMQLRRAYLLHGVGDQFVPYDQSRRMFAALRAAGVPASLFTFTSGKGGVQGGWYGATWTPTLPTPYGPAAHDGRGGLATGERIVAELLAGRVPDRDSTWREHVVDETTALAL